MCSTYPLLGLKSSLIGQKPAALRSVRSSPCSDPLQLCRVSTLAARPPFRRPHGAPRTRVLAISCNRSSADHAKNQPHQLRQRGGTPSPRNPRRASSGDVRHPGAFSIPVRVAPAPRNTSLLPYASAARGRVPRLFCPTAGTLPSPYEADRPALTSRSEIHAEKKTPCGATPHRHKHPLFKPFRAEI